MQDEGATLVELRQARIVNFAQLSLVCPAMSGMGCAVVPTTNLNSASQASAG